MAKKRKSRASEPQPDPIEPQQTEPEQQQSVPALEPEPETEQEHMVEEIEEVEEEEVEEVEEVEEEEVDYEDTKAEDDVLPDATNNENANGDVSKDAVPSQQEIANGSSSGEGEGEGEEVKEEIKDQEFEDEPIENLLEPFTKDQLLVLIKEALSLHPQFVENIKKLADSDPVHRKVFVHGLGWDTTAETLNSVFGKYGEIEDCKAVTDKATGKSKGYAFILFKHRSGAKKALEEPQKKIGNRVTSCQLASAGPVPHTAPATVAPPVSEYTQRKIFVSNVGAEIDPNKLSEFFAKFGEIEDGPLGLDKQTGKPKGFCLFVYKSAEGAKKALEEPHKNFEGQMLHCQKAVDGPKPNKGGGGGGGGSGGGYYQQQQHQHHGHHHHHSQHQYGHTAKKGRYSGGASGGSGSGGHLMAPSAGPSAVGFNHGVPPAALTPALGQALALLATQGAGLGFGNLLGGMGAPGNQGMGVAPGGYGGQGGAGYGVQPGMQGGYQNPQMGQGGVRPSQGGAPYMGHGH